MNPSTKLRSVSVNAQASGLFGHVDARSKASNGIEKYSSELEMRVSDNHRLSWASLSLGPTKSRSGVRPVTVFGVQRCKLLELRVRSR